MGLKRLCVIATDIWKDIFNVREDNERQEVSQAEWDYQNICICGETTTVYWVGNEISADG